MRPSHLASEADIPRQALRFYRAAVQEPTRPVMARIVLALRTITGENVKASELWYLGEQTQDAWPRSERSTYSAEPEYRSGYEPRRPRRSR